MRYFIIFLGLLLLPAGDIRAGEDGALEIIPETADTMKTPVPGAAPEIVGDTIASVVKTVPVKIRDPQEIHQKSFFHVADPAGGRRVLCRREEVRQSFFGNRSFDMVLSPAFSKFQGEMWRRDYRNFAAQYAGANSGRTEDVYYQNIYEYASSYWYNADIWAEARMIYPDDPASQEIYVAGKLYGAEDAWTWQTNSNWYQYRGLRVKSQEALHRISYSYGAAILNHLLSAVNAARLAKKQNKLRLRAGLQEDWQLRFLSGGQYDFGLALNRNF